MEQEAKSLATRPDEHDPYWEYDDGECWNCGGEGYVYGCSWDWQCSTYDAGEGTCLCSRRCDVCNPSKPDPELQRVLSEALALQGMEARQGGDGTAPSEGREPDPEGDAQ